VGARIGAQVAAEAPRQDVRYRYGILGTEVSNAFALPGGYIFVTRGLLDSVESDDELAAVLAHEAGHVSKRHASQLVGGQIALSILLSTLSSDRYAALRDVLFYGGALATLAWSRSNEAQADAEGIKFAEGAGYDPNGLVRFFEGLGTARKVTAVEQYLATHPEPKKRVETARKSPLVRREDPAVRSAAASGFEGRGLPGAAEAVRRGDDPLALPPAPGLPPGLPTFVGDDRRFVVERSRETLKSLDRVRRANKFGAGLQQLLLVNSRLGDWRWLYLSARAYAVYNEIGDVYARTLRVSRTAPATFDALARYEGVGEPGSYLAQNSSLGRAEVMRRCAASKA
jgi:hypothetical protein